MSPEANYKKIVKEISLLTNQPMYTVEHILQFVFGKIKNSSINATLESYRIKGFGSFIVLPKSKPYHVKKIELYTKLYGRKRKVSKDSGGMEVSNMERSRDREDGSSESSNM